MNRMKFFTRIAFLAIVLPWAITSCNKINDEEVSDNQKVALHLRSGGEAMFRSTFLDADTQIPANEKIMVYVDETGGAVLYEKNILTADGSGYLDSPSPMYFPTSGNSVNIYALHTNATFSVVYPTTQLIHVVSADQTTLAGYEPSDLLYAKETNVAKTSKTIPLTFYHLLSKLQVAVEAGTGLTAGDIAGMTINGTNLQATFLLDKAAAPNQIAVGPVSTASASPIKIGADVSMDFYAGDIQYNDAIIVPQTLDAGTAFITVQLTGGGNLVYRLPAATTFESGKKYEYRIVANLGGLTLTTTIEDWIPVGTDPVTGEAVAE